MRFPTHAVIAAALLVCTPAYAAVEIDCPPESATSAQQSAMQRSEGVSLDEELKQKRKKARDEELARVKARFMQQVRTGATPAEPVPAVLTPAQ